MVYFLLLNLDKISLIDDSLLCAPLLHVLALVFHRYDADGDGVWSPEEFSKFVEATNGFTPPPQFARQTAQNFGSDSRGWLTFDGFVGFYSVQTADSEEETRSDVQSWGWDSATLASLSKTT